MGWWYKLHLDQWSLVVSGCYPWSALPPRHRMDRQQPHQEGSSDLGVRYGRCFATTAEGMHSSFGSWVVILLKWVSEAPVQAQLQGLDDQQKKLLRQFHGLNVFQIHQGWVDLAQSMGRMPSGGRSDILVYQWVLQSAPQPTHRWIRKAPWYSSERPHK